MEAVDTVVGDVDCIAFFFQAASEDPGHLLFVLDDEDAHSLSLEVSPNLTVGLQR
jgi:hypothetical protein